MTKEEEKAVETLDESEVKLGAKQYEVAQKNFEEIKQLKDVVSRSMLFMGKALKENRDLLYYKTLGHLTFESFIASPELSLHRSTVYKFIRVYEGFIEKLGIDHNEIGDIDADKLQLILPVCNKKNVKHWIEKARNLSRSDLRDEVQGTKQIVKLEGGEDWMEFTNVWSKTQPISRWGKDPKNVVYGQFIANCIKYFTKPSDLIVDGIPQDAIVKDICEEMLRRHEDVSKSTGKGEMYITYSDGLEYLYQNSLTFVEESMKSLKIGGYAIVYIKDKEASNNEMNFHKFNQAVMDGSVGKLEIERMIIINEKPEIDEINRAQRDNEMHQAFERIIVFKKK